MLVHPYPQRARLQGLETEIFKLVSRSATPEQWAEWLRAPLEHAAARGNLELFDRLLEAGANGAAGWRGCRGRTLLDAAALGGNAGIVSGLLRAGARPDVNVVSVSSRRSALYTAAVLGHEAAAIRLILGGANIHFRDPVDGRPVLHEAVRGGHAQLVEYLVISGADFDKQDTFGRTPLHVAAMGGHDGIVSTLLMRDADKEALSSNGSTPLHEASDAGHLCVVKTLLAARADFNNRRPTDNFSPLDLAASSGHVPVLQAILGHGADVNDADGEGYTALHVASGEDQAGAVDALIEAGADIETKAVFGKTPLLFAAYYSRLKGMVALLRHGAAVTARDDGENTVLHRACFGQCQGLEAAVDLLLRSGADETAQDEFGRTPAARLDEERVNVDDLDLPSTPDEIERTRLLLSRASADRAWRRRGWLLMLRSRAGRAREAARRDSTVHAADDPPAAAGGPRDGQGCKVARMEGAGSGGGGGDHVVRRRAGSGVGLDRGDGDGADGVLSSVVWLLVGVGPEGVFRAVLSFL